MTLTVSHPNYNRCFHLVTVVYANFRHIIHDDTSFWKGAKPSTIALQGECSWAKRKEGSQIQDRIESSPSILSWHFDFLGGWSPGVKQDGATLGFSVPTLNNRKLLVLQSSRIFKLEEVLRVTSTFPKMFLQSPSLPCLSINTSRTKKLPRQCGGQFLSLDYSFWLQSCFLFPDEVCCLQIHQFASSLWRDCTESDDTWCQVSDYVPQESSLVSQMECFLASSPYSELLFF